MSFAKIEKNLCSAETDNQDMVKSDGKHQGYALQPYQFGLKKFYFNEL